MEKINQVKKEKTIYDLKLHEEKWIGNTGYERAPGGWVVKTYSSQFSTIVSTIFVPFTYTPFNCHCSVGINYFYGVYGIK